MLDNSWITAREKALVFSSSGQAGLFERGRFWEMQQPELESGWEIPVHSCSGSKEHDRALGAPSHHFQEDNFAATSPVLYLHMLWTTHPGLESFTLTRENHILEVCIFLSITLIVPSGYTETLHFPRQGGEGRFAH